jgi:hypothetical protein
MEFVGKTLLYAVKLILFIILSIVFIPCFLVVNFMQKTWSGMLADLFNL